MRVNELRVKESDRIDAMAQGLRANGVSVDEGEDGGPSQVWAQGMYLVVQPVKPSWITASRCP